MVAYLKKLLLFVVANLSLFHCTAFYCSDPVRSPLGWADGVGGAIHCFCPPPATTPVTPLIRRAGGCSCWRVKWRECSRDTTPCSRRRRLAGRRATAQRRLHDARRGDAASLMNAAWLLPQCSSTHAPLWNDTVPEIIDVKKRFLRFFLIFVTFLRFLTFFIFQTFSFIFKQRCQSWERQAN